MSSPKSKALNNALNQMVKDRERQFNTFLEAINASIPMSITDADGLIVEANTPFCELCKYTETELLGKNHNLINSKEHSDEFFADFWNTISAGKKWKGELKNVAKDGAEYWVDIVVIPLLNKYQEIEKFISLQFPITERKLAQERLAHYIKTLEEMAFMTSHKIRKPITNIKGIIQVVEDVELNQEEFLKIKDYLSSSSEELDQFTVELNSFIYKQIQLKLD